jgi:hypothetical protein
MTALAKLPALLEHIETLESGQPLCRRRFCYAETFTWLSPFCEPACDPQGSLLERDRELVRNQIAAAFSVSPALLSEPPPGLEQRALEQQAADAATGLFEYGLRFYELLRG